MELNLTKKINVDVQERCLNWLDLSKTYNTLILKPNKVGTNNVLTQSMINEPNTKYVIIYNFDLLGQEITMPKDSILEINGGDIANGTIIGQDTILLNPNQVQILTDNISLEGTWNDTDNPVNGEDIAYSADKKLIFADKEYDEENFSGTGLVYLRKNIQEVIHMEDKWFFRKGPDNKVYLFCVIDNVCYHIFFNGAGLILENNLVTMTNEYDILSLPSMFQENALSFSVVGSKYNIYKPNGDLLTDSNTLNNSAIYPYTESAVDKSGKNVLTQEMVNKSNTKYVIRYDYVLNDENITLPDNCILDFEGGSISGGTLTSAKTNEYSTATPTKIINPYKNPYGNNLTLEGVWDYIDRFTVILSEEEYENLPDKRDDTIYFTVEE